MFTVRDSLTGQPVSDHPSFVEACRAALHYQVRTLRAAHVSQTVIVDLDMVSA